MRCAWLPGGALCRTAEASSSPPLLLAAVGADHWRPVAARRAVAGCFSLRTQGCGAAVAAAAESEARSAVLERGSGTCRGGSRPRAVVGKEHAGRGRCAIARPSPPPPPDPTSSCFNLWSVRGSGLLVLVGWRWFWVAPLLLVGWRRRRLESPGAVAAAVGRGATCSCGTGLCRARSRCG